MKSLRSRIITTAVLGLFLVPKAHAAEQTVASVPVDTNIYELRVYMGTRFIPESALTPQIGIQIDTPKPQIDTEIRVDNYFFAKSSLPWPGSKETDKNTLYIASGVLHSARDGKFSLDRTFMWAGDKGGNMTFGPGTMELELDKPVVFGVSLGVVKGYTAILTKVVPPAEPTPIQGETQILSQPVTPRP